MRKHGGTPSRRDKYVTLAAISPPGVARGRFVGGQQSGLAGSKPPPLFTREASSCSSQGRRQGEPWGASPRPSAPTYLPPCRFPAALRSLSCRFLSLPVVSCRHANFCVAPSCRSPVALLSFPPVALPSLSPVASLSPSCRLHVVFLPPPCRLPVASLSPPCRPMW